MLVCAFLCATCTRDRGCSAHPAFPAPSSSRGTTSCAKLGQSVSREHGFLSVSGEALLKLNPAPYTSSSRRTPGPIRRAVSFGQFVRDLLQQQTTGIMGPGVRRDDGILLSHSPKRKTRPLGLLRTPVAHSRDHWLAMTMDLLPPNLTRDVDRELQFRPLLFFGQDVALFGRGKAALRRQRVGRIMIRRFESTRWRVTPSAPTRPTGYGLPCSRLSPTPTLPRKERYRMHTSFGHRSAPTKNASLFNDRRPTALKAFPKLGVI
jgi:hypothetical protein